MKNQLISIIIPCYNQAQYLDECLGSVLNQTHSDWECIIVNDGSHDNTEEIAGKWCKKDMRFRYIKKVNGGLSSARNSGLKKANGDYIQFLDSDDIIANNKFELQLKILMENNCDIIISDHAYLNRSRIRNHSSFNLDLSLNGLIYDWDSSFVFPIHAALISKIFLLDHDIIVSEKVRAKEDYMLWVICAFNDAKFYYHDDILAYYREHSSGMTKNSESMIISTYKVFLEIYELLDERQREIYKDKMPLALFLKTIPLYTPIVLKKSRAYKIGAFFLFIPRLIKKFTKTIKLLKFICLIFFIY
jgi:glycosyltransferase involved in cell wall biosynthesis